MKDGTVQPQDERRNCNRACVTRENQYPNNPRNGTLLHLLYCKLLTRKLATAVQPQDVVEVRDIWASLCRLQEEVMNEVVGYQHSADCFCGEGGFWPLVDGFDYRNELLAIDFIERATRDAIKDFRARGGHPNHWGNGRPAESARNNDTEETTGSA